MTHIEEKRDYDDDNNDDVCHTVLSDTFSSNGKWLHINFPFLFSIFQQIVPQEVMKKEQQHSHMNEGVQSKREREKNTS